VVTETPRGKVSDGFGGAGGGNGAGANAGGRAANRLDGEAKGFFKAPKHTHTPKTPTRTALAHC